MTGKLIYLFRLSTFAKSQYKSIIILVFYYSYLVYIIDQIHQLFNEFKKLNFYL